MSKTFFTGCTHFDHANIIKLAGRPFSSVEEMNETLVENWNKTVGPNDEVYHLGDIAYHRGDSTASYWLEKLNGRKHLILGNHDNVHEFVTSDAGIKTIKLMDTVKRRGVIFALCHYPMEDWDLRYRGSIHLHCHTHQKVLERPLLPYVQASGLNMERDAGLTLPANYPEGQYCNRFNVTVEATNCIPISLDEIIARSKYQS